VLAGSELKAEIPRRMMFIQMISLGPVYLITQLNGKVIEDPNGGVQKTGF